MPEHHVLCLSPELFLSDFQDVGNTSQAKYIPFEEFWVIFL